MKTGDSSTLKQAHFHQILWLRDERAIDLLLDMPDDKDHFVRFLALSKLNELEFGRRFWVPENKAPVRRHRISGETPRSSVARGSY